MSKKKKVVILSCMIALLAVTAVFNFILTTGTASPDASAVVSSANYFTKHRNERLNTRNEDLLQLDAVIASAEADSAERSEALKMKTKLISMTENEMLLESLIKAYGIEDVVVIIGMDSDNVNVIAKAEDLAEENAIMIYSIIDEELNISPENVKIIHIS